MALFHGSPARHAFSGRTLRAAIRIQKVFCAKLHHHNDKGVSFTATRSSSRLPVVRHQFLIREQMLISTCERATEKFPTPKMRQGESRTRTITPAQITIAATSMSTARRIMLATVILKTLLRDVLKPSAETAPVRMKKVRSLVPGKVDTPTYSPLCRQTMIVTIRRSRATKFETIVIVHFDDPSHRSVVAYQLSGSLYRWRHMNKDIRRMRLVLTRSLFVAM